MLRRHFLSALAAAAAAPLRGQAAKDRQVIVISIDGFPAYALNDPNVSVPTIKRLAEDGAVADSMLTVNPSVTWPNHTSMVTGVPPSRHGVLYNGLPVRIGEGKSVQVEPWVPKHELVQATTVYDLAHAAGLTTAEVDWVAIHKPKTITWSFSERPAVTDPVVREMIEAELVTEAGIRDFSKTQIVVRDEIWTRAAIHILKKHKPNLLLFHLLATDGNQHRYGARSLGGNTALALADARVKQIVDAADKRATILIVSDHGFKTYDKVIRPNALMTAKGWKDDVWVVPEGGSAMVYVTRASKKAELLPKLRAEFASLKGIQQVVTPDEFHAFGFPPPNDRMADLVLFANDRFAFDLGSWGETIVEVPVGTTPGAHGYSNQDSSMHAIFIAWGAGIRRGVRLGSIRNLDVAPTIARLLRLEMNNIDGQVLTKALA